MGSKIESSRHKRLATHGARKGITMGDNGFYPVLPNTAGSVFGECVVDVPKFARDLFARASKLPQAKTTTAYGIESVEVGTGTTRGLVYKPTSDTQAERLLNYAIANLTAYVEWQETGKAALEAKKEAEAKAEAEKKEAERKAEAVRRLAAEKAKDEANLEWEALKLYNASNGTSHLSWVYVNVGLYADHSETKRKWVEIARQARRAKVTASFSTYFPTYYSGTNTPFSGLHTL